MSCTRLDSDLEEAFNDIEEFIHNELGFLPSDRAPITDIEMLNLGAFMLQVKEYTSEPLSRNFTENSRNDAQNVNAAARALSREATSNKVLEAEDTTSNKVPKAEEATSNKVPEAEVEVEIMDLKDTYDKKTRRTKTGLEYRLEDSEVTITVRASTEISHVRVYVQRCPLAAIRTHDTIGPVELELSALQQSALSRVFRISLDSVYRTQHGCLVYWLEKAEIAKRNKWELIIEMEFSSGLKDSVKSSQFRVTTQASHRKEESAGFFSVCKVQKICRKITWHQNNHVTGPGCYGRNGFLSKSRLQKDPRSDSMTDDDEVDFALSQELLQFNLREKEARSVEQTLCNEHCLPVFEPPDVKLDSVTQPKIILQPNTPLETQLVSSVYGHDSRVRFVVEQPDLPGLLKLVGTAQREPAAAPRRLANGHKSVDEEFWWACGNYFFERHKKSTIRGHVFERVCQKAMGKKKAKKERRKRGLSKRVRSLSLDVKNSEQSQCDSLSWKRTLSV